MKRLSQHGGLILLAVVASLYLASCRRLPPSNVDRNKAPETYVTLAPAESLVSFYRAHLYWTGGDPDGSVDYYEIAVVDSNEVPGQDLEEGSGYTKTLKTDSTFVFKADPPTENQLLGYRFFVRAVDNEGKVDPTPAVAYFLARNDNYPEVVFRPGRLTWQNTSGNTLTRLWTSTDRNSPTDTAGVEACYSASWSGRDLDPGGFVVGFWYKLGSQLSYQGGTLADTMASGCFPAGVPRKQILQVRAVDDGGLRSASDYTLSLILNFDPISYICHPTDRNPDGTPVAGRYIDVAGVVYPSGVTLPDKRYDDIRVRFTGYDDSRDKQSFVGDLGILSFEYREQNRFDTGELFGGSAFARVSVGDEGYAEFPERNQVRLSEVGSGDHLIQIRARDKFLAPESTPDFVRFDINYRPYFISFKARAQNSDTTEFVDLLNCPPGTVPEIRLAPGEQIVVKVLALDSHLVRPVPGSPQDLYDPNDVVQDESGTVLTPPGQVSSAGYRVYFSSVLSPPGFDVPSAPPGHVVDLDFEEFGEYVLIADVRDFSRTNDQNLGRIGTFSCRVRLAER